MSNSNANITLSARTDEFEAKLNRAIGTFNNLSRKGVDTSQALDKSFKTITLSSKNAAREIEQSFNALNIKSDFTLGVQAKALERNAVFFKQQYQKIRLDGMSSAKDITNAYQAMQIKLRQLSQRKVSFSPIALDHEAAIAANERFNEQRIANDKAASQVKIRTEKANLLAYEASEQQAFKINKTFNEARAVSNKQLAQRKIADLNTILRFERQVAADALAAQRSAITKRLRILQETNSIEKGILAQRNAGIVAGEQLREKAASSATQLQNASRGAKQLNTNVADSAKSMNLFNLASIASIAKIQVMFTVVNNILSSITQLPGLAFEAVESFNAASISGAAIITSMQKSTRDLGTRYQENLGYSREVNQELIRMDAHTAASFRNLSDMNTQFRNQGILIDINNKKQVEGFTQTANALAVLTAGSPNQDLQFTQEIKALLRGEQRPGNLLFDLLNTLDNGNLKETLVTWQEISKETGNAGFALEQLGPMLVGFKAAQKDIDGLWTTIKSTMVTIRDEVLREGFGPEFELIVGKMNDLNNLAKDNKVELVAMLQGGFENLNTIVGLISKIGPAWVAATAGVGLYNIAIGKSTALMTTLNFVTKLNPWVILGTVAVSGALFARQWAKDMVSATDATKEAITEIERLKNVVPLPIGDGRSFAEAVAAETETTPILPRTGTFQAAPIISPRLTKIKIGSESGVPVGVAGKGDGGEAAERLAKEHTKLLLMSRKFQADQIKTAEKTDEKLMKQEDELLIHFLKTQDKKVKAADKAAKEYTSLILKARKFEQDAFDETAKGGMIAAMKEYREVALNTGAQVKNVFTNAFSKMEDAMVKFMRTGKLSFSDLADSVINDILRIQAKKITAGLISIGGEAVSNFRTSDSSTSGSVLSSAGSAITSLFAKRETGGPVTAGQSYIVGEKRPELFTPGVSGVISPKVPSGNSMDEALTMVLNYAPAINAIDTQSGLQFLASHVRVIEGMIDSAYNKLGKKGLRR